MIPFLTTGILLGLSAGIAPGPLLALVVAETLQHDLRAGFKVALAPVLTDVPIILLTLFILAKLAAFHGIIGIISLCGGAFLVYLGAKSIKTKGVAVDTATESPRSLQKGILVNALSPHPYLFWLSVGGPLTMKAASQGPAAPIAFIASFYLLLVGSKIVLAYLVDRSRSFLSGKNYIFTMRLLGIVLIILAGFLVRDGLRLLGVI